MQSLSISLPEDDRNCKPEITKGIYLVHKKNMISQFGFGGSHTFDTIDQAFNALHAWLVSRKDSESLRVTLIERI